MAKKPRKYTSDSYWKARNGKFVFGCIDYMEKVGEIDFQAAQEIGVLAATTYEDRLCVPEGCENLAGLEFVFEVLDWRMRRGMEGGFVPKYSLRPMWGLMDIYQRIQTPGERKPGNSVWKPSRWLRTEHLIVIQDMTHEQAFAKTEELTRRYTARFWPRRPLELGA